jgi:diguanylate cyclase (GGDEF)-like protein/PAS domain S-box-containing protein
MHRDTNDQNGNVSSVELNWDYLVGKIAFQIRQSLDLKTILQTTTDKVYQLLNCDRVLLYKFDPDWSGQVVVETVSHPQWSLLHRVIHDPCFESSWLEIYQENQVRAITDIAYADITPCHAEFLAGFQIKANLVVPVICTSQLWGLLIAHNCTAPRQWETAESQGLQQIAVHLGIAIQQASLVEQLQTEKAKLQALMATQTEQLEQTNLDLLTEVKERYKLKLIVSEREKFLRQVLDSIFTFVGVLTFDGVLIEVNQAPLDVAGLTREQVLGQFFADTYWWAYSAAAKTEIQQAIAQGQQGKSVRFDITIQVQGGEQIIIDFSLNPLYHHSGEITHLIASGVDITQRKQAEIAFRQSRDELLRLAAIVESSQEAIISTNLDGIITSWNQAAERLFGYTASEIIGKHITTLIPPERQAEAKSILQRIQQGEGVDTYETQRQHKDGSLVDVAVTLSPIRNENAVVIGVSKIIRDIREGKRREAERKQAEKNLRHINLVLENVVEGIARLDVQGRYISVNRAYAEICGYGLDELIGEEWMVTVYSEDLPTLESAYQTMMKTGQVNVEARGIRKNGDLFYKQVIMISDYDEQGKFIGHYCFLKDISDRKQYELALHQSEYRYRNIIETTLEGVWMLNAKGRTTFVNQRMADMLGYTCNEMLNTTFMDFMAEEDRPQAQIYMQRRQQGIEEQHPFKFQRQDGTPLWVIISATPMLDHQGNFLGVTGLLTDITQFLQVQEALKTSEMQLSGVLNSSLDGIMAFRAVRDDQDQIIDFEWLLSNPTAYQIVGREDLIGKRLLEEMPGNREEGLFDMYVQVVETGEPSKYEFYYNHEGVDCWFETIGVKLGDGFAVTFRNVTALKQSEKSLQILNKQLQERVADLDQRHAEMLILSQISDFLQACLTVTEACTALSHLVQPLFPDCTGGVFITNSSRNRVEMLSSWGDSVPSLPDFHPQDCWALRRGRIHPCNHQGLGLRCQHIPPDAEIAHTVCIPMIAQGETLGMFYLSTDHPNALSDAKQQIARTLAEQVALAIANLNLRETLQHQSIRDPLTGLFNRRYLEEFLTQEIARAQRKKHPIGVIMIDVDHFKRFNDTYGHEVGDYVLQVIGGILKENIRGADIPCRYGGEEMNVILPESSLEETATRAEQIRQAIAKLTLSYNRQLLGNLTISLGVASFPMHGVTGTALIQAADAALYRAKAAGRNQVIVAP